MQHLNHWYREHYMRQFGDSIFGALTDREVDEIQAILDDSSDDDDLVFN